MHILRAEEGIVYCRLEADNAEPMARLLADVFCKGEPMAVAVGLTFEELFRLVSELTAKAVSENLSIVALDVSNGQLLGALLADDFGTTPPPGLELVAPRFAPVGALLDGLDDRYRASREVRAGTHAHIYMVGVSEPASSRGIARRLIEVCINNAAGLGYDTAITEATGSASQHVFRKLGFTELLAASYRDFRFNGGSVFAGIQGVAGTLLMTLALQNSSQQQDHRRAV